MRYYAAYIARFISTDPLQFEYPYYTPFQYAGNKPISYIDLDGAEEALPKGTNPELYEDDSNLLKSNDGSKLSGIPNFKSSNSGNSNIQNAAKITSGLVINVQTSDVSRKKELFAKFESIMEGAFNNGISTIDVTVNPNGQVEISRAINAKGQNIKMDKYQRKAFKELEKVVNNKKHIVPITIIDHASTGSKGITGGSFDKSTIDVDDIRAWGNNSEFLTSKGKFVHELSEQYDKVKLELKLGRKIYSKINGRATTEFIKLHGNACKRENKCNKIHRDVIVRETRNGISVMDIYTKDGYYWHENFSPRNGNPTKITLSKDYKIPNQ